MDILGPENPYRHLKFRGRVAEITEEGTGTIRKPLYAVLVHEPSFEAALVLPRRLLE